MRLIFLFLLLAAQCFAVSSTSDLLSAIKNDDSARAASILIEWASSKDPAIRQKADDAFRRTYVATRIELPESMIEARAAYAKWVLTNRQTMSLGIIYQWYSGNNNIPEKTRNEIGQLFVGRISDHLETRNILLGGDGPGFKGVVISNEQTGARELRLSPHHDDFTLAKALWKSGALAQVKHVRYGGSGIVELSDLSQVDAIDFIDFALSRPELHSALEALRRNSTPTTQPSRLEITKKMIDAAVTSEPRLKNTAQSLREKLLSYMVGNHDDGFGGPKERAAIISLQDESDLKVAQMLRENGLLDDVQLIKWRDVKEVNRKPGWEKVIYPAINHVNNPLSIKEILDPNNFERADSWTPKIWRKEKLRLTSYKLKTRQCDPKTVQSFAVQK